MKIIFAANFSQTSNEWLDALRNAMPECEIIAWDESTPRTDAEIAVVWSPSPSLLVREPNIRALFNMGAGVDALLSLPGLSDKVSIYRLEDAGMSAQMAEYVVYYLVRASRGFDHFERAQQQEKWDKTPDIQRDQWPVGVMGLGLMGAKVAEVIASLDYPVAGWSNTQKNIPGVESFAGVGQLKQFLQRSRVLVNILPLTSETSGILNFENMSLLISGAYIINVGRGGHLVEDDLIRLLEVGHVSGATLDVFRQEPLPQGHQFWSHPKINITPHIAAATLLNQTTQQLSNKIRDFVHGKHVTGQVRHGRGY